MLDEFKMHETMDANVWTNEFCRLHPDIASKDLIHTWFANLIMCGYDHANYKKQKIVSDIKNFVDIQGSDGNWNYCPYMHGMFNGLELALAALEDREPKFKEAPSEWIKDNPKNFLDVTGDDNATT